MLKALYEVTFTDDETRGNCTEINVVVPWSSQMVETAIEKAREQLKQSDYPKEAKTYFISDVIKRGVGEE